MEFNDLRTSNSVYEKKLEDYEMWKSKYEEKHETIRVMRK